jgi:predicted cupin superfamily sugar epimerase
MLTAQQLTEALGLLPHPEGGFYRETYRASEVLPQEALGARHSGPRSASTAIYFLVTAGSFSALHRIASDEVWHFYAGHPLEVVSIDEDDVLHIARIGMNLAAGEVPQYVVPKGRWFGSRLTSPHAPDAYALVGCTVAPGFDFADFELADRGALIARHPQHQAIIEALTR